MSVIVCRHDGLAITRKSNSARRARNGWSHAWWGGWEGIRCPGDVTGAEPEDSVRRLLEERPDEDVELGTTMDDIFEYHEEREKRAAAAARQFRGQPGEPRQEDPPTRYSVSRPI